MTDHVLKATCQTVHLGGFSPHLKPALVVDSGDRITVETYTGYYVHDQAPPEFLTPEFLEICQHLPYDRKVGPGPHLLTGPIYINQAQPGHVLEITLEDIHPRLPIGFNAIRTGWGALSHQFSTPKLRFIPLDLANNTATFPPNSKLKIPLQPFFGILGVAPPVAAKSSIPPGFFGGNMDNKELIAGSRIFLPVFVPGGLFSIGDGHAVQGDGEVNVTALETSMNGTFKIKLHQHLKLTSPIAETPTDIITMGFAPTLEEALNFALNQMIDWLKTYRSMDAEEAYVFASLAVDFHITQVVNSPQKGVHGILSKSVVGPWEI